MKKPRIAIPEIDQNISNYRNAAVAVGMEPIAVSVWTEHLRKESQQEFLDYAQFDVKDFDGLLLPGGGDINPSRFGQENCGSRRIEDELDELQFSVLDAFVKSGKPVLGICKGHQVINVYFGGTILQHLPTAVYHINEEEGPDRVHSCIVKENSWLADLYGREFFHNSIHHQAVDRLGENLVEDSYCPKDGVVEALHHSSLPVYGLQWHPERLCLGMRRNDTVDGLPVMQFFCRLCGGEPERFVTAADL